MFFYVYIDIHKGSEIATRKRSQEDNDEKEEPRALEAVDSTPITSHGVNVEDSTTPSAKKPKNSTEP